MVSFPLFCAVVCHARLTRASRPVAAARIASSVCAPTGYAETAPAASRKPRSPPAISDQQSRRPARGHARSAGGNSATSRHRATTAPPIASAASTMRGSRRRAAASIEKPKRRRAAPDQRQRAAPGAERDAGGDAAGAEHTAEHEAPQRSRPRIPSASPIAASAYPRAQRTPATAPSPAHARAGRAPASISACAVPSVSAAVNRPCSNSIRTIGSLSTISPERRRQRQPDREFQPARFRMRHRMRGRRRAARGSVPAPARCPSRRRRCRAAVRSGDWRNRATTPPTATTRR